MDKMNGTRDASRVRCSLEKRGLRRVYAWSVVSSYFVDTAPAVGSEFPHRHQINVEGLAQFRVPLPRATSSNRLQYEEAQGRSQCEPVSHR